MSVLESVLEWDVASISFVRDYVEVNFDGPILRLLGQTRCEVRRVVYKNGEIGFCDALVSNIGQKLVAVEQDGDNSIAIRFANRNMIFTRGMAPGKEYAHFVSYPDEQLFVWEAD